jgi:hypothetical protein
MKNDLDLDKEHHPDAIRERLENPVKPSIVSDAVLGGIDGCVSRSPWSRVLLVQIFLHL